MVPHALADRLLSVADLDPDAVDEILEHAAALKAGRTPTTGSALPLAGRSVALIFEKPSLRTRVSFEVGIARLGGTPVSLHDSEIGLGVRESVSDATLTLERYVDAIVARVKSHAMLEEMADVASIPVVNALSDREHPLQALADVLTLREHLGEVAGKTAVFIGDGNNVCASFLIAAASLGMNVRAVTPVGYEPDPAIVAIAKERAAATGGSVELSSDPKQGVLGADAIYTDVWTSMGQEAERQQRLAVFPPYAVNEELVAIAPEAVVMHCLPAHRGEEIASSVLDGPKSVVLDQAENRMWIQMAALVRIMSSKPAAEDEPIQLRLAIASRSRSRRALG
jgi:ornithine carbamoyltransferase